MMQDQNRKINNFENFPFQMSPNYFYQKWSNLSLSLGTQKQLAKTLKGSAKGMSCKTDTLWKKKKSPVKHGESRKLHETPQWRMKSFLGIKKGANVAWSLFRATKTKWNDNLAQGGSENLEENALLSMAENNPMSSERSRGLRPYGHLEKRLRKQPASIDVVILPGLYRYIKEAYALKILKAAKKKYI